MRKVFIILSILALMGCSEPIEIQLDPEVNVYLSDGGGKTVQLTSKDKEYAELNKWLSDHKSDWYSTSGQYRGGVYIKSGKYGIQVTKIHVVLYSTSTPKPRAIYIQQIGVGELKGIRNFGK